MTVRIEQLSRQLAKFLRTEIGSFPDGFFDSFRYTSTGNALTHPLVLGLLARFSWSVKGVTYVGLDVALKEGGVKFKPDVVAYSGTFTNGASPQPVFFLDLRESQLVGLSRCFQRRGCVHRVARPHRDDGAVYHYHDLAAGGNVVGMPLG